MPIALNPLLGPQLPVNGIKPASATQKGGFGDALQSAISAVENSSDQEHASVSKFLAGDSIDIHSVAIASQRAEVSMELFQQVRNKLVSAYQEIMRSQL